MPPRETAASAEELLTLAGRLRGYRWVDLSHALEPGIPAYPTHARFDRVLFEDYSLGDVARHHQLTMDEHTGTHIDAPLHFIAEGPAHYGVDEIPLEVLAGRAATIAAPDLPPAGTLTADHIKEWEAEHGNIEPRDRVLIRYGWDRRWATGLEGRSFLEEWPGLSRDAAEYLLEREVSLVGCDTLSVDAAASEENPAHYTLLGNEIYIVENLNNLDRLPPFCLFVAFPLRLRGGSGSPIRAVALVPAEG